MHFLFVADYLPTPNTSGAGMHLWSLVKQTVASGHQVSYLVVGKPHEFRILDLETSSNILQVLADLGVQVFRADMPLAEKSSKGSGSFIGRAGHVGVQIKRALAPRLLDYEAEYEVKAIQASIAGYCAKLVPDAVFVFDDGPIAATRSMIQRPCVAWPSDPIHLLFRSKWDHLPLSSRGKFLLGLQMLSYRLYPQWITSYLKGYEGVIHQAAHHAAWFRRQGVHQCQYIPTPIIDDIGPDVEARRSAFPPNEKFKILHVGHLGGAASMTGLSLVLDQVLPILEHHIGSGNFEIHFVGRTDIDLDLIRRMERPTIRLRGFVENLADEFLTADCLLVPIPHNVGSRTRLLTGLSYGSCVVAHESCKLGNPELQHEQNVLLASDGAGLAREIIRAWRDTDLRRQLRLKARQTYEKHFSLETAGARWVHALEVAGMRYQDRRLVPNGT
jgi:glycosyltransferase involved in cell wall biosynthesis